MPSTPPWRPRSIRGRITALVAALAMLLLAPSAALAQLTARRQPVGYAHARDAVHSVITAGASDVVTDLQAAVLVALAVWAAWHITGRTLRPVEAIRAELAATDAGDLSGRVPEPAGDDEIARLARTVNGALTRLENAGRRMERVLDQQRRFTSEASHELRTPVAGLRAQLEEARLDPEHADLGSVLDRAIGDVDRLQAIITDLLVLARIDAGAPSARREVDLAEAVRLEVSRRTDMDRLPVRLALDSGVIVKAVETQIGRVLTNLLDNAQRHARKTVAVEVRREGHSARLAVTDDGDGVAEEDRERIFERFTRLTASRRRDRGGTGLGLAIVRDIAHAHGGTVEVGTSDAGGARFVLRLPLAGAPTGRAQGPATRRRPLVSSRRG